MASESASYDVKINRFKKEFKLASKPYKRVIGRGKSEYIKEFANY